MLKRFVINDMEVQDIAFIVMNGTSKFVARTWNADNNVYVRKIETISCNLLYYRSIMSLALG